METIMTVLFVALLVAMWVRLIYSPGPSKVEAYRQEFSGFGNPPLTLAPLHPSVDEVSLRKSAN